MTAPTLAPSGSWAAKKTVRKPSEGGCGSTRTRSPPASCTSSTDHARVRRARPRRRSASSTSQPDHRQVIVETYLRDRSHEEVAAELGVPPGTLRSRLFYGLKALRVALDEMGVTP